ncbi:MAG TPA: hypothetical protein VMM38_12315 [Aridibacter sp.]|nr:hypothetical protein [Aridibacter sp.]
MPQKIYKVSFAVIAVLAVFVLNHYANTGKITGEINLNLQEEKIFARLKYDYVATGEPESHVKFYLNESFNVKLVECARCRSFKFDRESERLPVLIIPLAEPLQKGERLMIEIEYDGSLAEMYHREFRFLELGLDWFWYPVHRQIGQFDFRYQLTVKTDMPEFQMAGNGRVVKQGKNWIIDSKVPDYDIDLVLSDRLLFKRYAQDGYDLEVVSKNLPEEVATELLENIRGTLSFYNSTFGKLSPQREVTAVIRPFPETSGQGGYFRKGYFILPKVERAEQFFFPIAHELAHYWWIGADQQNAWLNESFAEFSAMLAVRKLKGADAFNEILEKKKKLNENLPPVYGFDRSKNRQQSPLVLYVKGALKLYELEEDLSKERFLEFLRKLSEADVKDTDSLIELLAEFSSHEVADRFLARLKV